MRYTFCASSRQDSECRLRAYAALKERIGFAPWTAVLRSESRIVGWGGLNIDPFDPGWGIEVAYFFHPAYWGKGLGAELVQTALEHGFVQHALTEINAFAHPENQASIHVLEKCGFQFQCFVPRLYRYHYVVRRKNWLKAQSARIRSSE